MKKQTWFLALTAGAGVALAAYSLSKKRSIPEGATAFQPFDKNRYTGIWNEIARLPSFIEDGLQNLTENYSLNEDGTLKVITRAYNLKKDKWRELEGKIKFAGAEDSGALKVSYFRPAYVAYNILDIDKDYNHALVCGSGLGYLWILSRENAVPDAIKEQFLTRAKNIGFAVDKLEWFNPGAVLL